MKAYFIKENDVTIVRLKGNFNFESIDSFGQKCKQDLKNQKVVFNLQDLAFVGSSGFDTFMSILKDMNSSLRVCNASCEFVRMFQACHLKNLEIYESENLAKKSF